MNEKFVQLAEPEQLEEYPFYGLRPDRRSVPCGTCRRPCPFAGADTGKKIFRYYFLRQPQRVIGVHIGRTRSTAGRHIQLALQRLREEMEACRYE